MLRALGLSALVGSDDSSGPRGDYSAQVTPSRRATRAPLTVERALSLPATYRAIQITAGMGAQLTIDAWRADRPVEPVPAIVTQPDPWRPLSSWIERVIVCLAIDGNAFLLKHRGPGGQVVALEVLNPFRVTVNHDGSRRLKSYSCATENGRTVVYAADEIEHVWGLEVPGRERGLSPIAWCKESLSGVLETKAYADQWFSTSDVPSGVLSSDQQLTRDDIKTYRDVWRNPDDSRDVRGPSVRILGRGLSYQPITLKPEEAQWLQAQNFGILDIARMWGMPADYLLAAVEGTSLTYSNLEMIDAQYLRTTLFPVYLRKIEAAITAVLPRGQEARFSTEQLLRPDAKTRAEIDRIYLDAGVLSREEIRRRERWAGPPPPMPTPKTLPTVPASETPTK